LVGLEHFIESTEVGNLSLELLSIVSSRLEFTKLVELASEAKFVAEAAHLTLKVLVFQNQSIDPVLKELVISLLAVKLHLQLFSFGGGLLQFKDAQVRLLLDLLELVGHLLDNILHLVDLRLLVQLIRVLRNQQLELINPRL